MSWQLAIAALAGAAVVPVIRWAWRRLRQRWLARRLKAPKPVCRACLHGIPAVPERGTLKGFCSIECSMAPEPWEEDVFAPPADVYVPQLNTDAIRRGMAMQNGDDE